MHCKVCNSTSNFAFTKKFIQKYDVAFFRCSSCGFLQTQEPYLLAEAYKLPFTPLDINIISRTLHLSKLTEQSIVNYFDYKKKFLDYGGGIGVFTRLMRDRGFDFYRQDKYAQNLCSQYFDISDLPEVDRQFELITCFEVLEHLPNPMDELADIFSLSNNLLCSTMLQPSALIEELESWFYIGELHGQHICFYTQESMEFIAAKFGRFYYSNDGFLHLFTTKKIESFDPEGVKDDQRTRLAHRVKNKLIRLIEKSYQTWFTKHSNQLDSPTSLASEDTKLVTEKLKQNLREPNHSYKLNLEE